MYHGKNAAKGFVKNIPHQRCQAKEKCATE
jgi:hypothetical protein